MAYGLLSGFAGLPPGLRGYVAAEQLAGQRGSNAINQASGLLSLQNLAQQQQMNDALMPLKIQQLQMAVANAELNNKIRQSLMGAGTTSPNGATAVSPSSGSTISSNGIDPLTSALLLSGDPGLTKYAQAIIDRNKPIAAREGAPVINPATGQVIFSAVKSQPGINIEYGPQGPTASGIPGYAQASADLAATQAGAKARAEAPYQTPVETVGPSGEKIFTPRPVYAAPYAGSVTPDNRSVFAGRSPQESAAIRSVMEADKAGLPASITVPAQRISGNGRGPTIAQEAEFKQTGKKLGDISATVYEDAAKAAVGNRYLDQMENYAKDFTPGKLAPMRNTLTQWAQAFNLPVSEEDKRAAGSIQGLTSMAIKLAGQATRQSDAQPSQLQYFKILESMPNEQRTPEGFARIISYMRDLNNLNIIKAQELQKWRQSHNGSAEGFEAQWPTIAKSIPLVWNQQQSPQNAMQPQFNAQEIVDELRRRGAVK